MPGEVLVHTGQKVKALDVVARTEIPSRYRVIDVARQLGRAQVDMSEVLLVEPGEPVQVNQVIATIPGGLPFLQRSVRTPAEGYVTTIGAGWVLLETERTGVEIQAFVDGVVTRVLSRYGVIIETEGTTIEAVCGFGGEAYGRLRRIVDSPFESLKIDALDESTSEMILVGGRTVNEETLRQAEVCQVRGIIVGSIQASLLNLDPPIKVRVVATEGYGDIPMSPHTFGVLNTLNNKDVSIRGQIPPQIREAKSQEEEPSVIYATGASQIRGGGSDTNHQQNPKAEVGSRVRITHGELLGVTGKIDSMPSEPQTTDVGIITPGAQVNVNSEILYVPWANLELIG